MAQVPIVVRQEYRVARNVFPLILRTAEPVLLRLQEGQVELRVPNDDESPPGSEADFLLCTATVATTVGDNRKAFLDELAQGRMPAGSKGPRQVPHFQEDEDAFYASVVDEHGNLLQGPPPREYLPTTLDMLLEEKSKLTHRLAEDTLRMIRWRAGLGGRPTILDPHQRLEWSDDREHWHRIWSGNTIEVGVAFEAWPLRDEWRHYAERRTAPILEPLGHELYHEAERLRLENPRSALLTLIMAAEVGVKECITALVPEADWLVQHVPSPPVVALFRDYLPRLGVNEMFGDRRVCPPPEKLLHELEAAIKVRNNLIHTGKANTEGTVARESADPSSDAGAGLPSPESLRRKFEAVRDLLWLLDYYRGHDWAMEHASTGTHESFPRLSN